MHVVAFVFLLRRQYKEIQHSLCFNFKTCILSVSSKIRSFASTEANFKVQVSNNNMYLLLLFFLVTLF